MPVSFESSSTTTARQQSTKTPSPPSTSSISSYPSSISSSSDSSSDSDEEDEEYERALIQEEWNESMRQMQMLFSLVLMPFFGRWWGRRWSYWGKPYLSEIWGQFSPVPVSRISAFERYLSVGLSKKFWGLV
jgi:hypothetical protein